MICQERAAEFAKGSVDQYTMRNKNGMEVAILNYGGVVRRIVFADKAGEKDNRILSYRDVSFYEENPMFFGAVIGRVAGRIKHGAFCLDDGKLHLLERNEGRQHLHGGTDGFHHRFWTVKPIEENGLDRLELRLQDKSHDGYPGDLDVCVTYTLSEDNVWRIEYHAETDVPTICNMTNHTYFNLAGALKHRDVLEHDLQIHADRVACVDEKTLPTGAYIETEKDEVFNFAGRRELGQYGMCGHPQLDVVQGGYDHAFLLNKKSREDMVLYEKHSGIKVAVKTSEEAVVVYTCNKVPLPYPLEQGTLKPHAGVTLETQAMPDRIHSTKPETVLITKEKPYDSYTTYAFSIES